MFKIFSFFKKKKKITFLKNKTNYYRFFKQKEIFFFLDKKIREIEKTTSFSKKNLIFFWKEKFFNHITFKKTLNVKKMSFVKNRKALIDTLYIKYSKSRYETIQFIKDTFLKKKDIYKKFIFWYKMKKIDIYWDEQNIKDSKTIEYYEQSPIVKRKIYLAKNSNR